MPKGKGYPGGLPAQIAMASKKRTRKTPKRPKAKKASGGTRRGY